jgi:hypothetical protein
MKLCFKHALTRKPHLFFGLDVVLNWLVLPSVDQRKPRFVRGIFEEGRIPVWSVPA